MFTQMQNFNFAAPIRFALPLLQQSGWKRDEAAAETGANPNDNSPATKDARPSTTTNTSR